MPERQRSKTGDWKWTLMQQQRASSTGGPAGAATSRIRMRMDPSAFGVTVTSPGAGFAVSAGAVEWLDGMPGAHFIRLTNAKGELDLVLAADQVPLGPVRSGFHGAYHIVDQRDLAVPDFSPVPF
jgi:hypothetical protein